MFVLMLKPKNNSFNNWNYFVKNSYFEIKTTNSKFKAKLYKKEENILRVKEKLSHLYKEYDFMVSEQ